MVQHLDQRIFWGERPTPAIAVVSVDDVRTSALVVASLAVSLAEEGKHVLVADLTGHPGARDDARREGPGHP